ncbi:hypothetical protein HDR63_01835, partial [bacterium]|nr:hypothetical protein [bacterium]
MTYDNYGGKAAGLKKLGDMHVPVPKWMALTWEQANQVSDEDLDDIISLFGTDARVAVRSSATNEDGASKSFAGVFETKLNVPVQKETLKSAIRDVVASATSVRAGEYDAAQNAMGIVIQQMVEPVLSGVAFTRTVDTNGHDVVLIEMVSGLGEKLVSGMATPTQVTVPINNGILNTDNVSVAGELLPRMDLIRSLIEYIQKIIHQSKIDLDIEWCIDANGDVWFVQARPITVPVLIKPRAINSAIPVVGGTVTAPVYVIPELGAFVDPEIMEKRFADFPDGAILVALYTEVDFVPIMKRASGIITEQGGVLSHAAILSRELSIPCIVNYPNATRKFKTGDVITMNATTGRVEQDSENGSIDETIWLDEAWCFDHMIRVPYQGGCVFVESLFNRLNVYAPWIDSAGKNDLDLFIRKKFGAAPTIITQESGNVMKFYSWFEDRGHKKLPGYAAALARAYRVAASGSAAQVHRFYESCIHTAKKYIPMVQGAKNAAARFYYEEAIMAQYILLDVIFPRAIAMNQIYMDTAYRLYAAGATFADLLAGKQIRGISKRYHEFIKAIADERNDIYPKFRDFYPPIVGYWKPENQD